MRALRAINVEQVLEEAAADPIPQDNDEERKARVIDLVYRNSEHSGMSGDGGLLEMLHAFVQNIVVHLKLEMPGHPESKVDVKSITRQLKHEGTKYNDSRFRAFRRNFTNPSGGAHMFDLLNAIATGTKNVLVTEYLINVFVESLRRCPHTSVYMRWVRVMDGSWTQVNVVSNMSLPFGVDLTPVHNETRKRSFSQLGNSPTAIPNDISTTYNPKKFTGLIIKLRRGGARERCPRKKRRRENRATALVFETGSMVFTGLSDVEQTRASVQTILPILLRHMIPKRRNE